MIFFGMKFFMQFSRFNIQEHLFTAYNENKVEDMKLESNDECMTDTAEMVKQEKDETLKENKTRTLVDLGLFIDNVLMENSKRPTVIIDKKLKDFPKSFSNPNKTESSKKKGKIAI